MTERPTNKNSDKKDFNCMDPEEKILYRSYFWKVPEGKPREEALADLKKKISEMETGIVSYKRNNIRMILWISSVAAGILLLIGIWQLWPVISETKVTSGRGVHTNYLLPDGSEVNLNAESRIIFKKKNFSSERQLTLEGEAFFNVTKGSSFRIITPKGEIMVPGTSFNIFSRDNTFKVACITGKIIVSYKDQSVTIEQGESAELSGENLRGFSDARLQYVTGWINGEFYFENTPLDLVFDEIERQFNVKFAYTEKAKRFFTGSFTNKDLIEALETICIVMNLNYEIGENEEIWISSKK